MATPIRNYGSAQGTTSGSSSESNSPTAGSPVASLSSSPEKSDGIARVRATRKAPKIMPQAPRGDRDSLLAQQANAGKRFTFNDSHFHHKNYRQDGLALGTYIEYMNTLGIRYTTLMPIPTSVSAIGSAVKLEKSVVHCGCSPHYYLLEEMVRTKFITKEQVLKCAEVIQLIPFTDVDVETASAVALLNPKERARLDPMITGLHLGSDDLSISLLKKLKQFPDIFTGVGEITIHKEVVDDLLKGPWANLTDKCNSLLQLLKTCGDIGMPVVIHCDVSFRGESPDHVPKYLEDLKKLFAHEYARETTIIWAHAGGLGRFVNAPGGHVDSLKKMLGDPAFKNVHIDLSWKVVAERLTESPETVQEWARLINAFPDRFLFGSDALVPGDTGTWNATYQQYEGLRQNLTYECIKKVCRSNYKRVFVAARKKVREFEKTRLTALLEERQSNFEDRLYGRTSTPANATAGPVLTSSTSSTSSITRVTDPFHTAEKVESAASDKTGKSFETARMHATADS